MKVFFYGLFMDESLLASRGISPSKAKVGYVEGYALNIGERATLVRKPDSRAYGLTMEITEAETAALYSEESVADYVPEPVTVRLQGGAQTEATCYNLPAERLVGTNRDYAKSLLALASRLGFPGSYLDQVRGFAD